MKINNPLKKGFTLVETMVGLTILTLAIIGPLYIALNSAWSIRSSRDFFLSQYLAQEGLELIRYKQDTIFLGCVNGDAFCVPADLGGGEYETPSESAWRHFIDQVASTTVPVSCAVNGGCLFDIATIYSAPTTTPSFFSLQSGACSNFFQDESGRKQVATSSLYYAFFCKDNASSNAVQTPFRRVVTITQIVPNNYVCPSYDCYYNTDLRIESKVSYIVNGFTKFVTVTDYLRPRN